MVEVIEEGLKNRIKCEFCGSMLKYKKTDIKLKEIFESPMNSHFEEHIICPECANEVFLKR